MSSDTVAVMIYLHSITVAGAASELILLSDRAISHRLLVSLTKQNFGEAPKAVKVVQLYRSCITESNKILR